MNRPVNPWDNPDMMITLACHCRDMRHDFRVEYIDIPKGDGYTEISFQPHVDYSLRRRLSQAWDLIMRRQLPQEEIILDRDQVVKLWRFLGNIPLSGGSDESE